MSTGRNTALSLIVLGLSLGVVAAVTPGYRSAERDDVIRKGPGVSEVRKLSGWFGGIRETHGDTNVYVLDSGKPGATGLILGGTHGNEPAGYMTAILIVDDQCEHGPNLVIYPQGIWYGHVRLDDVPRIIEQTIIHGRVLMDLLIPSSCLNNAACPHVQAFSGATGKGTEGQ